MWGARSPLKRKATSSIHKDSTSNISSDPWGRRKKTKTKPAPGLWGTRTKTNLQQSFLKAIDQPSDQEHKEKSPNLLEHSLEAIPVEPWEVVAEAISTTQETSTTTLPYTWVAGFLYIKEHQLETTLYQKYILTNNQYCLNPSQYRQAYSYQKAGQRS